MNSDAVFQIGEAMPPPQFSVIFQEKDYQLLNDLITSLGEDIC